VEGLAVNASVHRRSARWAWALVLLVACGDFDSSAADPPGADAGAIQDAAGPAFDAGLPDDFQGLPAEESPPDFQPPSPTVDERLACYAATDGEAGDLSDCTGDPCDRLRTCCIGDGDCCGPADAPSLPAAVDFASCDHEATLQQCLDDPSVEAQPFGAPGPRLEPGGLAPGGDATFDAGLVIGEPLDLRARRVELDMVLQGATGCGTSCVEGAGIAFTTQTAFDDGTRVRPLLGVIYGGSKDEVTLVVADETVGRWPLPADGVVRLVTRPTGTASLHLGEDATEPTAEVAFVPDRDVRLVIHGRNREPGSDGLHARVASVAVHEQACDMPAIWADRAAVTLVDPTTGETAVLDEVAHPSLAHDADGTAWLAFEERRPGGTVIRLASRTGDDPWTFELVDGADAPALAPADGTAIGEPALVPLPDGAGWVLLYTFTDPTGTRHLARAEAAPLDTTFAPDDGFVLSPADLTDVTHLGAASVARRPDGTWAILVQAETADGPRWRVFTSDDTDAARTLLPLPGGTPLHPAEVGIGPWLDLEGVADPSLVLHDATWRVFYGRRRGTRPAIAALASDELLAFRHLETGAPVLDASDEGFDRLGAHSPGPSSTGGQLELVYMGFDGAHATLGLARVRAPLP
jgi:hypothetical protein